MITGFNTDIEHSGVTYHVQTEDKGLETPLILSLVYVGGAIIASKRSPYQDLIDSGFDETTLTERLQRQHKLICAAIKAGRVDDLKRMGGREESPRRETPASEAVTPKAKPVMEESVPVLLTGGDQFQDDSYLRDTPWTGSLENFKVEGPMEPPPPLPPLRVELVEETALAEEIAAPELPVEEEAAELYLTILEDEGEFRAGQLATIKIHVGRGQYGQKPIEDALVTIKVLGTTFRPLILSTRTGVDGVAVVRALLPRFSSGRAAIIIRASEGEEFAEMRRIIHQA